MESPEVVVQWLALSVSTIVVISYIIMCMTTNHPIPWNTLLLTTPYLFTLCHPFIIGSKDVKRSVDQIVIYRI